MTAICRALPLVENQEPQSLQDLTVGEIFKLSCTSEQGFNFGNSDLKLVVPGQGNEIYRLKLIHVLSVDQNQVELSVTSYRVGEFSAEGIVLSDGVNTVGLEGFKWTVKSSIDQKAQEQVQPFPHYGAAELNWGWPYILSLFLVVSAVLVLCIQWWRRRRQLKKLYSELDKYLTVRPAFDEFHRELRHHLREYETGRVSPGDIAKKVFMSFRMYIVRELRVPAFQWKQRHLLTEIRRQHSSVYEETHSRLRHFLRELDLLEGLDPSGLELKMTDVDLKNVIETARSLTEAIQKVRASEGRRR